MVLQSWICHCGFVPCASSHVEVDANYPFSFPMPGKRGALNVSQAACCPYAGIPLPRTGQQLPKMLMVIGAQKAGRGGGQRQERASGLGSPRWSLAR